MDEDEVLAFANWLSSKGLAICSFSRMTGGYWPGEGTSNEYYAQRFHDEVR